MRHDPLPSSSATAAKQAAQRAAAGQASLKMPENKAVGVGWRKKIQNKPKEFQPLKLNADDTSSTGRHYFSRKTIHGSRPATPATPVIEETEDGRSEPVDPTTPRRSSKPKLVRYTSLFTNFKDLQEPSSPDFSEPWSDVKPDPVALVDPMVIIQSIRSHMARFSTIPLTSEHNSGLFRVFEHYCKLRSENEAMEAALQQAEEELTHSRHRWSEQEREYAEEIRRLELLIAKGTTGVAGVLHARHGSVVDRRYMHRKTVSGSKLADHSVALQQIDAGTNTRRHDVLHRSTSASEKMAALSKQFTYGGHMDLRVGTPPRHNTEPTLARKAHSEFDLSKLASANAVQSLTNSSLNSGFSGAGDPLPDELSPSSPMPLGTTDDCDTFEALRELGTVVARRRGLDTEKFLDGLMALLSSTKDADSQNDLDGHGSASADAHFSSLNETTPIRKLRKFQSQPQMNSEKRRRHFSFEPGEDYLQALREASTPDAADRALGERLRPATFTPISQAQKINVPPYETSSPEAQSLSKIPTPVQPFGSLRRETSVSSLGSVLTTSNEGRHHSQSSILTAFRSPYNGKLRPNSSSRSSSYNNLSGTDSSPRMREDIDSVSGHHANQMNLRASPAKSLPRKSNAAAPSRSSRQLTTPSALENATSRRAD